MYKVELKPLRCRPCELFYDDICSDKNDWRNKAMALYYNKENNLNTMDKFYNPSCHFLSFVLK